MTRFEALDPAVYALPPEILERTLSPALIVYLDEVRENLRRMIAHAGVADRWRPHVKTAKIPAVFAEVARAGVRHFKCATTREALHLLATLRDEGVSGADVLVAYPLVRPALAELGRLAREFSSTRLSVLCEDPDLAGAVPDDVSIFVDVNPGMHRTGLPLEERDSILAVARAAGARFRGVHFYDGHLHDGDLAVRRRAAFACYDMLLALCDELREAAVEVGEVVTSGTPTFRHALAHPGLAALEGSTGTRHRISPGTVVYHDLRSEQENPDLDLVPAALVLARVVSHPGPGLATCDAGSKSIAAEAGDPCAFVLGRPGLQPQTPSEEHLPLRVVAGSRPARGEELYLVPRHVCPTVNLAEEALLVDRGEWRVVPVSARAHPLTLG